jgi:hypothetical protein
MTLALVLVSHGMAEAEARPALMALAALLGPGDHLVITDNGADPDLSAELDLQAEPEILPEGAALHLLRFGAMPPAGPWAEAGAALGEGEAESVLLLLAGQIPDAAALAAARAELAASGADLVLAGLPPTTRADWLARVPDLPATPVLIRRGWLRERGIYPTETGPDPGRIWHWRLCALAGRIGWIPAPPCPSAPPALPRDGADLMALHAALCDIGHGLEAAAPLWLIRSMAAMAPAPSASARWDLALRAAECLATCPEPLWQAAIAGIGPGRAATIAAALRRGAVIEVVTLWGQEAGEARLAALEAGLAVMREGVSEVQRGVASLCRLAEYDALAARAGDDGGTP